ncbi:MAG: PilW family protein [Thiobacillus sp.]|nr:PilW family protein [Thiobacillus sp.]
MTHGHSLKQAAAPLGRRSQVGLSLIELLVAMGLGLILVLGIGTVYLGSRQSYRMQEANARVQETGRFALEIIGRSLRLAGVDANITEIVNENAAQCDELGGACTAINGTDDSTNGTTSDTFTVQYYAGLDQPDSNGDGLRESRNCLGDNADANVLVQEDFALVGNDLQCTGTVGGVASAPQTLVSEIEDFQIIYGVDSDNNQSADIYTSTPTGVQWPNVVTAKVCVMVRSADQGLAPSGQTPLDCPHALDTELIGTVALPAINDTRLHRAFVATYNLRNRISNTP